MRASDRAHEALRREIVEGLLPPGTVLGEVEQAARLGVSRTPLREALARLVSEGLADQTRGRGTVVSAVSPADVEQLFEVRIPLDVQAARLAARRAEPTVFAELAARFRAAERQGSYPVDAPAADGEDVDGAASDAEEYYALVGEMDAAVDDAVANPRLVAVMQPLRTHLARIRRLSHDDPQRLRRSADEHAAVCRAVAAGDEELAAATMLVHLRASLAHIQHALRRQADTPPADTPSPLEGSAR
ncbi:GntR family transcriptional regulator [Nesterenkonia halophila]|uniref:GntR family transcriptional regulator n=1 Tax=Nesterenkonia halophila TaxID=302044 RepID=UPI0012909819|nr:GntR family transcriptional regulator [Nesterenkonia halophila]